MPLITALGSTGEYIIPFRMKLCSAFFLAGEIFVGSFVFESGTAGVMVFFESGIRNKLINNKPMSIPITEPNKIIRFLIVVLFRPGAAIFMKDSEDR